MKHLAGIVVVGITIFLSWQGLTLAVGLEAFEKEKIVPDAIDVAPKTVLDVKYGDLDVDLGNLLFPSQVKDLPNVTWDTDADKLYLLSMIDLDVPTRRDPILKEGNHYLVGNIPGGEISKGEVIVEYVGSGPPKDSGLHRYVFLLFEQPKMLTFDEERLGTSSNDLAKRAKFSIRNFAKKYNLGDPVAGNFFQSEWQEAERAPKLNEYEI